MNRKIELDAPNVGAVEKEYLCKCVDTGFVSTFGPYVQEFEEKFATYMNVPKAVSTQSGTAALHIALRELGVGAGDEVIVPTLTFVATANPILYVDATPIFADVDIKTWNIDPKEIEKKITKKTKAIVPVHLYGNPCDMGPIMAVAKKHGLSVIEDATESLGSRYAGQLTGTIGELGCFSFNGNKVITTGGGGMVVGQDPKKIEHIKFLVNQARDEVRGYYHPEMGFNYRLTNLEAALGLAQLSRLDKFLAKKKKFDEIYREQIGNRKGVRFQDSYPPSDRSCWLICAIFSDVDDITVLQKQLREKGVPTRRVFMPIVDFPHYRQYKDASFENSYHVYSKGLCLPTSTLNSEEDVVYVCDAIKSLI